MEAQQISAVCGDCGCSKADHWNAPVGRMCKCCKCTGWEDSPEEPGAAVGDGPAPLDYAPDGLERCCGDLVRKVTETDHYVLNHQPTPPVRTRVFYECATCGRRLGER